MCSRHAGTVAAHRLRQRSRRPARHVVCPFAMFSPTAFLRLASINNFEKRNRSKKVTSLQADSEGVFFSSESAEKKHTGWVGQACLQTSSAEMPTNSGWVGQACLQTSSAEMPIMRCSRHAGTVAAHRLRQRSRRPARHVVYPLDVFTDSICESRNANQLRALQCLEPVNNL